MKRHWFHYLEWEDYQAGMWRKLPKEQEREMLVKCAEFTGDHIAYGKAMKRAVSEWPKTCLHNLTNPSLNKLAFIGHCACCLEFGCPEYVTRAAWSRLTDEQRFLANNEAFNALRYWQEVCSKKSYVQNQLELETENTFLHPTMGSKRLPERDTRRSGAYIGNVGESAVV